MDWYSSNCIKANPSKTKLIGFTNSLKMDFWSALFWTRLNIWALFFNMTCLGINTWLMYVALLRKVACMMYNIKVFVPFGVKKMILHSLVYIVLRYGVTSHAHCSVSWWNKVNNILKEILRSVGYNSAFLTSEHFFKDLFMPFLHNLFTETVVLRHFWIDKFKNAHKYTRLLRVTHWFGFAKYVTRWGKRIRHFCVPYVFNCLVSQEKLD